jgi:hypothetical protein
MAFIFNPGVLSGRRERLAVVNYYAVGAITLVFLDS